MMNRSGLFFDGWGAERLSTKKADCRLPETDFPLNYVSLIAS
jgi:hypothetical protein